MTIARIEADAVAETRDIDLLAVPEHKRAAWRVVEVVNPVFNQLTQSLGSPVFTIEADRVIVSRPVTDRPIEDVLFAIKSEARRRITGRYPEWKQSNMTARGVELQDIWRRNGAWSASEQTEADALAAAWAWITAVRAASDAIEQANPIPSDFASDSRWP